jgi:uncharacterized protein
MRQKGAVPDGSVLSYDGCRGLPVCWLPVCDESVPMPVDQIRYDLLMQDALRSVIRVVLTDVAVKGLPGEHHFYVTFDTRADGVRLSARLKASYPEEMTIVLQHQFRDLAIGEDGFDVGLQFNGIPERLHIPFRSIKSFMDPSVQFGLQFAVEDGTAQQPATAQGASTEAEMRSEAKPTVAEKPVPAKADKLQPRKEPAPLDSSAQPSKEEAGAEVVRLDRFRKK